MNIYIHNLSPFAIRFTETFGVRWYGLSYLSGFVLGWLAIRFVSLRGNTPMTTEETMDFTTYSAIGVLGGGRVGYCLFYSPDLLVRFDNIFPFWGLLKVNEGGMSSHGGILGVMLICYLWGRKHNIPVLHLMDLVALGGSFGFLFGRIANFINGELYGRAAPGVSWAVKFPQEMYLWFQREVGRLTDIAPAAEALGQLKVAGADSVLLNKQVWFDWAGHWQDPTARNYIQQTIDQIIQAIQTGNMRVTEALAPVLTARYPSQLIQAFLEGFMVLVFLCLIWLKPKKPGVLGASFGVLYSLARILGEQYRMPDAQIGFQLWGLTRGQWLSVGLLAVAILFLTYVLRRDAAPMGGFAKTALPELKKKRR